MTAGVRAGAVRSTIVLGVFLAICFLVAAIGGSVTQPSVADWYQTLAKPPFNPPDLVFAPVWTVLYIMIAVSGWRVWRVSGLAGAQGAMTIYAVQLVLNLAWTLIFFGAHMIGLALVEIVLLLAAIVATIATFRRHDRLAALLLVPYALWVVFAAVLNASIFVLN